MPNLNFAGWFTPTRCRKYSIPLVACALAILAGCVPTKAQAQELLTNPGFEDAGGWSVNDWSGSAGNTSTITTTPHSGSNAQKVEVTALPPNSGYVFKQDYTLTAGKWYEATVWLRPMTATKVQFYLRRAGQWYDPVATRTVKLDPTVNAGWQKFTIRGGSTTTENFFFGINFLTTGSVVMDDASLTDVSTNSPWTSNTPVNTDVIPKSYFGIHINKGHNNVWPALNQGLVRLWDTGTMWLNIEPSDGHWDWQRFDMYVDTLIRGHDSSTKILYTLGQTPQWAAENPQAPAGYGPGASSPPADMNTWREYVRNVATRYAGKIQYYELWNETDVQGDHGFYSGTPEQMVAMVKAASEEIHAADPNAIIIAPNVTIGGLSFMDAFLTAGGDQYVDAYSIHVYSTLVPENALNSLINFRELLTSYGINKPVFNSEGRAEGNITSDSDSRAAVARNYLLNWAFGACNFTWYAWDIYDPGYVPLGVSESSPNLSEGGVAYANLAEWLTGAQMTYKGVDANGLWTIGIKRGDDYKATILWKQSGAVTYSIPAEWNIATRYNLNGTASSLVGQSTVDVTTEPILLEAGGNVDNGPGNGPDDGTDNGPMFKAKINFQPAIASVPSGFLPDSGGVFGARSAMMSHGAPTPKTANATPRYGWKIVNRTAVDCNLTSVQEKDTLIVSQGNEWNIEVPSGVYKVRLVAGDPRYFDENYKIDVEGVPVIDGATSSKQNNHYVDNTVSDITCTDGRLTVSDGEGAINNKICFLEVEQTKHL